jgi:hypothetical protein
MADAAQFSEPPNERPHERAERWLRARHRAGLRGMREYTDAYRNDGGSAALGFSWRTLRRVRKGMPEFAGARPRRHGYGSRGSWEWEPGWSWILDAPVGDYNTRRRVPRPGAVGLWLAGQLPLPYEECVAKIAPWITSDVCEHRRKTTSQVAEQELQHAYRQGLIRWDRRGDIRYVVAPDPQRP